MGGKETMKSASQLHRKRPPVFSHGFSRQVTLGDYLHRVLLFTHLFAGIPHLPLTPIYDH